MAAEQATPLREPSPGVTVAQRFKLIQNEMAQLLQAADASIRQHIDALMTECDAAQELPLPPGQKEELRQIAASLRASVARLNALEKRR